MIGKKKNIYIYFYIYIEKRTEHFRVLLQKNETFSRSFLFFKKERNVLCVLFWMFFVFFSGCSLRSFPELFFVFFSIL